ncbi:hypothetical protein LPW36_17255 [Jinshanibacter sp. LJY008]|uniref:Uncharacterized protein n=1 Tax=Limnobaculum eriocheiris TaxID=2897391 RepID=A0A9X1MZV2_9GAMM|nr:hypothetical protein [Limnobaculum eriocheiris]MCD1127703.1 hypothetical protein [Limnobaculum eriocheiris]
MNWATPEINRLKEHSHYTCWVIGLLIFICIAVGITYVIINTPIGKLYSQSVLEYETTIIGTLVGVFFVLSAYALPVEHEKIKTSFMEPLASQGFTCMTELGL